MINPELIFITFIFLVLVGTALWMKIPKITFPLGAIYLGFIFSNTNNLEKKVEDEYFESDQSVNDQLAQNNNFEKNKSFSNDILVEPIKPRLEPKPLTFNDGRTKKEKVKEFKVDASPSTDNNKEIVNINLEKDTTKKVASYLTVEDIKICKSIYKRTPVGSDIIFSNTIDSLYCYSRIKNTGSKVEVRHVWYYENKIMTQVKYNVKKSNIYRSWTKKTILQSQIGNWKVDILDSYGTIIGSKKFRITKPKRAN